MLLLLCLINEFLFNLSMNAIHIIRIWIGCWFFRHESQKFRLLALMHDGERCRRKRKSLVVEQRMFCGFRVHESMRSGSEFGVDYVAKEFGLVAFFGVAKETLRDSMSNINLSQEQCRIKRTSGGSGM